MRRRVSVRRVAFSLVTFALAIAALELGLRIAGFRHEPFFDCPSWWSRCGDNPIFEGDPHRFWRLRPNANQDLDQASPHTQTINAGGFRDAPVPIAKAPGEFRVVTLGDSCTFGDGVANWETYAHVLEERLDAQHGKERATVLNAGVPGYTSYQIREYLERDLLAYKPDVVVVYVGFNDNIPPPSGLPDRLIAAGGQGAGALREALHVSRAVQLVERLVDPIRRKIASRRYEDETPPDGEERNFRVTMSDYVANLCAIKRLAGENGARTIVMTLPHAFDKVPERNPVIRRAAGQCGIPLLDLWAILKEHQKAGEDLFNPDGGHPNAHGHAVIAGAILEKLREMNAIAPDMAPAEPD
ncbi:SGNH/GDSL hydrolase family protein [bacterium]|nr:SGNH/GDSL hydrolase family protein [bacterium]